MEAPKDWYHDPIDRAGPEKKPQPLPSREVERRRNLAAEAMKSESHKIDSRYGINGRITPRTQAT